MDASLAYILPRIESIGVIFFWFIFLLGIAESLPFVSIVIPSGLILIAAGFIASEGAYHPTDLIWAAALGSVIGDSIGYFAGRNGGRGVFERSRFYSPLYIEKADAFFARYGGASILLGRFIGVLRPFIAFVAGMHKMPFWKFLLFNIPSALAWVALYVLIGFFFGEEGKVIGLWVGRTTYVLLTLSIFAAVGIYFFARRKKALNAQKHD